MYTNSLDTYYYNVLYSTLPGVVTPGTVSHQLGSMMDWYSTALDIAGIKEPDDRIIDGMSLLPLFINGKEKDRYT